MAVKKTTTKKKTTKKTKTLKREDMANDIVSHIKTSGVDVDIGFLPETGANVKFWLDTGSYTWNFLTSGNLRKGMPIGRVVEVYGESGTGKSLMAAQLACMAEKAGITPVVFDTELAFTNEFAERLGANPKNILAIQGTKSVEKFDKTFSEIIAKVAEKRKSGFEKPVAVFLDSLAMLSTEHELKSPNKVDYSKPKKIRQFFRTYMDDCHRHDIFLFVINQVYDAIGVMFGETQRATGGHGTAFASTVRFNLKKPKIIKDGGTAMDDPMATVVKAKTIKNRVSVPERSVFIVSNYQNGVDRYGGLFELMYNGKWQDTQYIEATNLKIIQKDGQKYKWPGVIVDEKGEDIKFARKEFVEIFKENEEKYVDELQKIIEERKGKIAPDPLTEDEEVLKDYDAAINEAKEELEKIQGADK